MENQKFEIGDIEFEIKLPLETDPTRQVLMDWINLIEESKQPQKDTWTQIPIVPGCSFKNLKVVEYQGEEDASEISLNFIYDSYIIT